MSEKERTFPLTSDLASNLVIAEHLPSTNAWQRDHLSELPDWAVVVTFSQTAGRGRLGRSWVSEPGGALAASILFPVHTDHGRSWLPLIVGAALVEAVHQLGVGSAVLKWPNDVLVGSAKLAGTLCEVLPDNRVVVGLGVNLVISPAHPAAPHATDLSSHGAMTDDVPDALLSAVIQRLMFWRDLRGAEEATDWARAFVEPMMGTLGTEVSVLENEDTSWSGRALGLDDFGHLLVREASTNDVRTVIASDILHLR
jgi:BirA family biotin operon repressor/biotin-[acetyl-CoA-carboxylase] ligase